MSARKQRRRVAVLDLGSASFHLVIADVRTPASIRVIADKSEDLALGTSVGETGGVQRSDMDRAVSVATRFAQKAEHASAIDIIVAATSALRIASNGDGLIERIEDAIGREVRTISGEVEAILAYVGARAGLSLDGSPTVVADLGGGSLDVARGVGPHVLSTASLPLGALRLAAEWIERDPPSAAEWQALAHHISTEVATGLDGFDADAPRLVVTGGTAKALSRLDAGEDLVRPHGYRLRRESLQTLESHLLSATRTERRKMPGMPRRRVDAAGPGAAVLRALTETIGVPEVTVSRWGFREGIMLTTLRNGGDSTLVGTNAERPAA
jgi:exopolyphosphatase / guanosine-5'-triphosphate,3'-diphosphate pyrophosphatase